MRGTYTTPHLADLGIGLVMLWAVTAATILAAGRGGEARFSVMASLFAAISMAAGAAVFLAVAALCSRLAPARRAAGIAAGVFGAAFLLRVAAYSSSTLGWLHWATSLGWIGELRPSAAADADSHPDHRHHRDAGCAGHRARRRPRVVSGRNVRCIRAGRAGSVRQPMIRPKFVLLG